MQRRLIGALVAMFVMASGPPAAAQYNQFPGVAPPVPAPAPPAIAPGPAAPQNMGPPSSPRPPAVVQRRRGPPVEVPRGRNDSFGDRAANCVHYGTAAGVGSGEIGQFTRDCVNN